MRSTTTTIETIIPADLPVEAVVAGAAAGATAVLAVSGVGPTGSVGTAASATGLVTVSVGAGVATGVAAGFRDRADAGVRCTAAAAAGALAVSAGALTAGAEAAAGGARSVLEACSRSQREQLRQVHQQVLPKKDVR